MKKLFLLFLFLVTTAAIANPTPKVQDKGRIALPDGKHQLHRYVVVIEGTLSFREETVYVVENLNGEVVAGASTDYPVGKTVAATKTVVAPPLSESRKTGILSVSTPATHSVRVVCADLGSCVALAKAMSAKNRQADVTSTVDGRTEVVFSRMTDIDRLDVLDYVSKKMN